jgi:hypothetical protein
VALLAEQHWDSRRHFLAAAEAMRWIPIENARRKGRVKHGGGGALPHGEGRFAAVRP